MVMNTRNNIINSLLIFLVFPAAFSCSNDFLNQDKPVAAPVADTIRMTSLEQRKTIPFNLPKAGNTAWRVYQFPAWMKITPMEGNFNNGQSSFQVEIFNPGAIPQFGILSLPLAFDVEGIGYVQYPFLLLNFGNPQPTLSVNALTLDYQSTGSFHVNNSGGGILLWEITSKPAWITLSMQEGYLDSYTSNQINFTIKRDNLPKGDYSGDIVIATNSLNRPALTLRVTMKVFDPALSGNSELIEGEVTDAAYCKATGALVLAVKNPNRMYLYQPGQTKKQLDLQKIPINVAISEKGDLIAASFTNTDLSVIDPESFTIQKNIQTGMISSDLALGNNGWAYLSPKLYGDINNLISIDLNSGAVVKNDENLNGLTCLRKVPGKSLLYGSFTGYSPDFLLVFDVSKGAVNPVFDQWWTELNKFWLTEDGQRLLTGILKIYQSPDYQGKGRINENPLLLGQLEPVSGFIYAMDHSLVLKEIILSYTSYNYETGAQILRIDDTGYFVKKTISLNKIPLVENGYYFTYIPEVPYIYVNNTGKELILIKSVSGNSGKKYWYFEKITL